MTALVFIEHDFEAIADSSLAAVTAARTFGDVHALVTGKGADTIAEAAAKIDGVAKVLHMEGDQFEHILAEEQAEAVLSLADGYDQILAAATMAGKNFMPRVAAALDVSQISDIIEVVNETTFKRPIYAGNAIATVESTDAKKVITVRGSTFDKAASEGGSASVEKVDAPAPKGHASFEGAELTKSDRPELTSADIIVSGGRGLGSGENFAIIEKLADKLGAAVGASRAAVDAGFVPNDYQVGQTGKIVAPDLYIACGISGAIQHLAGMKDSKIIVAINKDEEAPIFQVADYGLVADLFDAVPELTEKL
ncbi:electron transfer flavoprotein subunit alpha/FixB family protein [Yunchengibacter salinarum]|uniref:electron transfer flavoprotein subunit alpha/FixB family protein n=1 Tax=Yunchengibacter salinarum TaxID=3133399 RepID=UPI0035B6302C